MNGACYDKSLYETYGILFDLMTFDLGWPL